MVLYKKALARRMANTYGYTIIESVAFIEELADVIKKVISEGDSIIISGFGKFDTKTQNARVCYHPLTREPYNVPAHSKVRFTAMPEFEAAAKMSDTQRVFKEGEEDIEGDDD